MTELQIVLVQRTSRYLLPIGDTVAELFYRRLFELDPALAVAMAGVDLRESGRKLMQTIAVAAHGLRDLERVAPVLEDFAREHAAHGLRADSYDMLGRALFDTMQVALGDAFTRDVYRAWLVAYQGFAPILQRGAAQPVEPGRGSG